LNSTRKTNRGSHDDEVGLLVGVLQAFAVQHQILDPDVGCLASDVKEPPRPEARHRDDAAIALSPEREPAELGTSQVDAGSRNTRILPPAYKVGILVCRDEDAGMTTGQRGADRRIEGRGPIPILRCKVTDIDVRHVPPSGQGRDQLSAALPAAAGQPKAGRRTHPSCDDRPRSLPPSSPSSLLGVAVLASAGSPTST
jgi:hypothetical protein